MFLQLLWTHSRTKSGDSLVPGYRKLIVPNEYTTLPSYLKRFWLWSSCSIDLQVFLHKSWIVARVNGQFLFESIVDKWLESEQSIKRCVKRVYKQELARSIKFVASSCAVHSRMSDTWTPHSSYQRIVGLSISNSFEILILIHSTYMLKNSFHSSTNTIKGQF